MKTKLNFIAYTLITLCTPALAQADCLQSYSDAMHKARNIGYASAAAIVGGTFGINPPIFWAGVTGFAYAKGIAPKTTLVYGIVSDAQKGVGSYLSDFYRDLVQSGAHIELDELAQLLTKANKTGLICEGNQLVTPEDLKSIILDGSLSKSIETQTESVLE